MRDSKFTLNGCDKDCIKVLPALRGLSGHILLAGSPNATARRGKAVRRRFETRLGRNQRRHRAA